MEMWAPGFILGFQTGIIVSVAVFIAARWLWRGS